MKNELLHIGPFTVYGYGLMIGIGIVAAYFLLEYRAKKKGLNPDMAFGLVLSCCVSGFIGAKLLYLLTVLQEIIENPSMIWDLSHGWVVYGGLIFGALGGALYSKIKKVNVLQYLDLGFPSVALAQGFGRIGCFLAGCCYGKESDIPIAITFHHSDFAPNDVPLLPTQLISSAGDFLLFFALIYLSKRLKKHGQLSFVYIMLYSVGRFVIEFFRGDMIRGRVGAISTSQFIGIFTFAAGVAGFLICTMRKEKKNEGTEEETGSDEL